MPRLKIDGDVGHLEEGMLRKGPGGWVVQTANGIVPLEDILTDFKNKEVRVSVVDIKEVEHYRDLMQEHEREELLQDHEDT